MITSKEIKMMLRTLNIQAQDVAKKMGITKQAFSCLIYKKVLNQKDLQRIASAIGVRYVAAFVTVSGQVVAGSLEGATEGK